MMNSHLRIDQKKSPTNPQPLQTSTQEITTVNPARATKQNSILALKSLINTPSCATSSLVPHTSPKCLPKSILKA